MSRDAVLMASLLLSLSITVSGRAEARWAASWDDALRQASVESKFIVLDVATSWCGPCQWMAREVYPDPIFAEFSKTQVFYMVDAEEGEGVELARRFRVDRYPSILVLDHEGKEIDRITGSRGVEQLIDELTLIFEHPVPLKALIAEARATPEDSQLQRAAAFRCYLSERFEEALPFLEASLRLVGGDQAKLRTELLYRTAECAAETNHHQRALDALDELQQVLGGDAVRYPLLRARCLIGLKKYDQAKALLDPLLGNAEEESQARDLLSKLPKAYRTEDKEFLRSVEKADKKLEKDDIDEALAAARKAVAIYPGSASAQLLLARACLATFHANSNSALYVEGVEAAFRARRLAPDDSEIWEGESALFSAPEPPKERDKEVTERFEKAEKAFQNRAYRTAAEGYIEILKLDPKHEEAAQRLGEVFYLNEDYEDASQALRRAVLINPFNLAANRYLADSLLKLGRLEEARRRIFVCISLDPSYPQGWYDLIASMDGADRGVERHLALVPPNLASATPDQYESLVANLPGKTAPVWVAYLNRKIQWRREEFARRRPGQPFVHTAMEEIDCLRALAARWREMRGDSPTLADPELDFLLQLEVENQLEGLVFLEMYYEPYREEFDVWQRERPEALQDYLDRFVFESPVDALKKGFNNAAARAYNQGLQIHDTDPDAALKWYRKALRIDPWLPSALANLSQILIQQEKFDEAESTLLHWGEAQPERAGPWDALALLNYKRGQYAEAIRLAEQALRLEKDPTQQERIRGNLKAFRAAAEQGG